MNIKEKVKESKSKTKDWLSEHKDDIIYGAYIVVCIGAAVGPVIKRAHRNRIDFERGRRIYDRSNGFYWETRRKLTNNQKMIIEQRHLMGEPYGQILRDMRLLKR